jgi:hypothetical protein
VSKYNRVAVFILIQGRYLYKFHAGELLQRMQEAVQLLYSQSLQRDEQHSLFQLNEVTQQVFKAVSQGSWPLSFGDKACLSIDKDTHNSLSVSEILVTRNATPVLERTENLPLPSIALKVRPCIILSIVSFIAAGTSLGISLWWTISHRDVSGGFTLGAYIIALATLPLGTFAYRHSSNCRCWPSGPHLDNNDDFESHEMGNMERHL